MTNGETTESSLSWRREAASDRRALLRLPVVFRAPEPFQFSRRTDECNSGLRQNCSTDAEGFAAGDGRGLLGRRSSAKTRRASAGLQGDAKGNAVANDSAARLHQE